MLITSKKAIVVGATSGIGKGMAQLLVRNGYKVGITGRRVNNLIEIKKEDPEKFAIKAFDVQNTKDAILKLEELISELEGLDVLIYCSGIGDENKELKFETELNTINTNAIGFTNIATYIFNYFKSQKKGQIVCISSIAGFRGNPYYPAYAATKAYLQNYTESLRIKSKKEKCGVVVTDLRAGFIKTGHVAESKMFWAISVETAVKCMLKVIHKKKEVAYIKKRWWVIMILMRLMPRWLYDRLPF
jgi:short-subunit dehydrogenase